VIYALILAIHLLICVSLVLVVLLQAGKGGGLAGAFGAGGGAAQTLFGGRGAATFLSKATTVLGIAFMTTSLALALLAGGRAGERSILRQMEDPGTTPPVGSSQPLQIPGGDAITLPAPGGEQPPGGQPATGAPQSPPPENPPEPAPGQQQPQTPPPGSGGN
jgi:preprotein translocase subunit SecG